VSLKFLGFQENSSFQNLCEFIGAILAVVGHVILGNRGHTLALRGDSVTALTWAITERPRGSIVTNAAMIWTLLCVAADVHIGETTHLPGEQNDNCDQLSRRGLHPTTTVAEHAHAIGIGEAKVIEIAVHPLNHTPYSNQTPHHHHYNHQPPSSHCYHRRQCNFLSSLSGYSILPYFLSS
jgi:hypothetical protein